MCNYDNEDDNEYEDDHCDDASLIESSARPRPRARNRETESSEVQGFCSRLDCLRLELRPKVARRRLASRFWQPQRAALLSGFHLSSDF